MGKDKAVYDVEMTDKTTGQSLGTKPVDGERESAKKAQAAADEIAEDLSELTGDQIEAGKVVAE